MIRRRFLNIFRWIKRCVKVVKQADGPMPFQWRILDFEPCGIRIGDGGVYQVRFVEGVYLRDEDGKVRYSGDVDLCLDSAQLKSCWWER